MSYNLSYNLGDQMSSDKINSPNRVLNFGVDGINILSDRSTSFENSKKQHCTCKQTPKKMQVVSLFLAATICV